VIKICCYDYVDTVESRLIEGVADDAVLVPWWKLNFNPSMVLVNTSLVLSIVYPMIRSML